MPLMDNFSSFRQSDLTSCDTTTDGNCYDYDQRLNSEDQTFNFADFESLINFQKTASRCDTIADLPGSYVPSQDQSIGSTNSKTVIDPTLPGRPSWNMKEILIALALHRTGFRHRSQPFHPATSLI